MSSNNLYPNLNGGDTQDSRRNAYYRSIFDKYDRDHDGFLNLTELIELVESREYENDIPAHVINEIYKKSDLNRDNRLDFDEFVEMINHPQLRPFFGHYVTSYIRFMVPKRRDPGRSVTDGLYEDEYTCYPPPVGMMIISLVEIIFFCVDEAMAYNSTQTAAGPIGKLFIFDPRRRREIWRFVTYMFVHAGAFHLFVNLLVQILIGIPLEMVHKWWRVMIIYFAGVLAGSLVTSIVDPEVKLAGASGGVYALITAHIATIILNWKEMTLPVVQLFIFLVVIGSDVGTAVYERVVLGKEQNIAYSAHFAGAVAGLLVGINVLRNLEITKVERVIWWISIVVYGGLMAVAIVLNLTWSGHWQFEKTHMHAPS